MGIDPTKFGCRTADQAATSVGLSAARLMELAQAGFLPHHHIDGEGPFFKMSEVKPWVRENLYQHHEGMPLPCEAFVLRCDWAGGAGPPPLVLRGLDGLCAVAEPHGISGVYFLVSGDDVVYVGQSVSVQSRVIQHGGDPTKVFSRAFYLPCPRSELDAVEQRYIELLKPKYNRQGYDGAQRAG